MKKLVKQRENILLFAISMDRKEGETLVTLGSEEPKRHG